MTETSESARAAIVEMFRRDLVGPLPEDIAPGDGDLQVERLSETPSNWYLTGFIAPVEDGPAPAGDADDPDRQEEVETEADTLSDNGVAAAEPADDDPAPEMPVARRRYLPSSIGLTVLVPAAVTTVDVRLSWGDYVTEPPLPASVLAADDADAPRVQWRRRPRERRIVLPVPRQGKGKAIAVPDSACEQRPGGGLELHAHARPFTREEPGEAPVQVLALSVFLVNRRVAVRRRYADIAFAFQARIEVTCAEGLVPRRDLSGYRSGDDDLRIADLHYRDEAEYAVGRNTSAGWDGPDGAGIVRRAWTDPLPTAEVERIAPNEAIAGVEFGMEALADLARSGSAEVGGALDQLPKQYAAWILAQRDLLAGLPQRRRETAERLIEGMEKARARMVRGIELLRSDERARTAFRIMNLAVARAARRRVAVERGAAPDDVAAPRWRPFQLAFILVNLEGLVEKRHADREIVDLLFFPTGGGKTEAYLGLAAFSIALRRLSAGGVLGAGVTVIMRYTLRLLTLDQLSRASGVVCALELLRTGSEFKLADGARMLGDWPIEIGLWVGSDASPNVLGGRGDTGDHTAVTRVRRYRRHKRDAPAPLKSCPWCGTRFTPESFACVPNEHAPNNMTITCTNADCDFTRDRPLPLLTVDQVIYRRLPAFLIATVDKFAGLPWVGDAGAFFGHVDRADEAGFYGAAEPRAGRHLYNDNTLDPPDLIIQDELHLISGPLGTVVGLYETALDRLCTRQWGSGRVRPKIVASTATVRRARDQICALFDRSETQVFPPPGVEQTDSWFAWTVPASQSPARLYLGLAAQGRGPKLVFLRGLTTLLAAANAVFERNGGAASETNPADPYMTALCYFNALRELGGARRIVEDEVRDRAARYGSSRRRVDPAEPVFADRRVGEPLELTSRVSTDAVAAAKARLEKAFSGEVADRVDVALATNMISVGLDIQRLGLMMVQGQPKTAAEYIQATSRVGRATEKPGLVVTVLNLHKPRDRTHYESFRLFHRTFYRCVEATSVTPWAARALDRSLAAVVVAIARHLRPELTPEKAVQRLRDIPGYLEDVVEVIVARAPEDQVIGGREALRRAVQGLLQDWEAVVDDHRPRVAYGDRREGQQLLHAPLDPALANLQDNHRRFVAARSMRDVEPNVVLRVRDPYGNPLTAEDVR
jgi:hypothetical protein